MRRGEGKVAVWAPRGSQNSTSRRVGARFNSGMPRRHPCAVTTALIVTTIPLAATITEAATPDMDEVVVSAQAVPGAVIGDVPPENQLNPTDIASYGVSTVNDLLNEISGADAERGGSGQQLGADHSGERQAHLGDQRSGGLSRPNRSCASTSCPRRLRSNTATARSRKS